MIIDQIMLMVELEIILMVGLCCRYWLPLEGGRRPRRENSQKERLLSRSLTIQTKFPNPYFIFVGGYHYNSIIDIKNV